MRKRIPLGFLLVAPIFPCWAQTETQPQQQIPNLVAQPVYETVHCEEDIDRTDESISEVEPPKKLQYEAPTADLPLLEEQELMETRSAGAEYQASSELVISVHPSFATTDEDIVDPPVHNQ